ncbi:RNA-binding protein 48 [Lethenteron reissneri]|uniref:RNA-binding protein 48 n=1 Tax=Lethenteron reissneri TaxID=7753 RepID=UPI002AB7427B|nr:RNA-binding protein 48 [Lethenteron reissneri]
MEPHKHHQQQPHCFNRPKYREGNRPRAVKVYTIAQESRYLLVQGVPALGAAQELVQLFALYGAVQEYHAMDEYPAEPFTDVYLIKYGDVHSARVAKRRLDERSFFGGVLHVCYAPEFESVEEARSKLQARRRYVERIARMPGPVLPDDKHDDTGKPTSRSPPHHEPKRGRREPHNEDEQASGDQEPSFPTYSFPMIPPPPQHLPPAARMPPSWRRSEDMEGYRESREHSDSRQRATLAGHTESRGPLNHEGSRRKNEAVARFVPRSALLEARNQLRLEGGMGGRTSHQDVNEPLVGPMLPPEIPKDVDLGDASLNASAELIRNRIRQVTDAAPSNVSSAHQGPITQAKARRRI